MDAFRAEYPTLCALLIGTVFDADAKLATEIAQGETGSDLLRESLEEGLFALNELMWLLCGAVEPELATSKGLELENNLTRIVQTLGIETAIRSYRCKLLVNTKEMIEDVCYELAVTARACTVLDTDSIQLEKPIPNPKKNENNWKNSDVYGRFHGQPVRIEVTVLHERLPPAIHLELDDLVRQSEINSGFEIVLRSALVDEYYAERVRALIELLHESHAESHGKDVEIDGVRFEWKGGAYHCSQRTSPFETICFYGADEFADAVELRSLIHPCSIRPTTPKYILEDDPNPPGVITSADLPDAPLQVPVSTKVHQMLDGKRQQCEEGVINIVALGNPCPMHDREVESAVLGPQSYMAKMIADKEGVRRLTDGAIRRDVKAPFVPSDFLASDDDRATFVKPFKIMSALWHVRLGNHAKSNVIVNPNASIPTPPELATAFSDPVPAATVGATATNYDSKAQIPESADGVIWTEMAQEFVLSFDSLDEARSTLAKLTEAGLSLDELRRKLEQPSETPKPHKIRKVFSPTNEELAMIFVVNCGGYEQAKACLEAYIEES